MKVFCLLSFFICAFYYSDAKDVSLSYDSLFLINSGSVIQEGVALHKEGKYELAIAKFLSVPESDTNYVMMRSELVNAYLESERYQEAIEISRYEVGKSSAYKPQFYAALGLGYSLQEQHTKAIEIYRQGLKQYPYDYFLHYNLGVSLFKNEEQEPAIQHLSQAITLNPFYANSHLYLGDIMVKQGRKSRAMMCFGIYLSIVPGNNKVLVLVNDMLKNALPYENSTPVEEKVKTFYQLDLLIKSGAALDKKFKSSVSFKAPVAQQTELLLESVKEEPGLFDFWMQFYVPLYVQLKQNGLKQAFVYHMLTSVDDKGTKKWLKSNQKEVDRFYDVANLYLKKFRAQQTAVVGGEEAMYSFWFYDNHKLNAIGNQKDDDTYFGPWAFYHTNGELMAKGSYLPDGKKTGKWSYYYPDGQLKKQESFDESGKVIGPVVNYYENGKPMNEIPYKDEKVEGIVKFYYSCGQVKDEISFKEDNKNGAGKSYYSNGQLSSTYSYKNGEFDGVDKYYYKNGNTKEVYHYKNGLLDGPYQFFAPTKKILQEGQYVNDQKTGEWIGFFEDGTIRFKGSYSEGKMTGLWANYSSGGKILSEEVYNAQGGLHGKSKYFIEEGGLHYEYEYKDGLLVGYKYYDKENKLLGEAYNAKGNLPIKGWYPDGKLFLEGQYKKGKKDGEWVYYHHNGFKSAIIQFKEDQYDGPYQSFYETGQKKVSTSYQNGVENGLYQQFHKNGKVMTQGWVVDGASQQSWISYFPDGTISYKKYFLHDNLHGLFQEFDKAGRPYLDTRYYQGNITHKTHYDTLGAVIRAEAWDMGSGKSYLDFANKAPRFEYTLQCNDFTSSLTSYHKNGSVYAKTPIKNGEYNGRYQSFYANKVLRSEGEYVNNEQAGQWTWYYESGKMETQLFIKDGELEGERKAYYENGQLSSLGIFRNGVRTGSTHFYAPDGSLQIEKVYDQHGLVSYRYLGKDQKPIDYIPVQNYEGIVKAYYPNGNVSVEQQYKAEYQEGVQLMYYPSGQLQSKRFIKMGIEDGLREEYYENGKIKKTAPYKDDEEHGEVVEYYPSGTIKRKSSYLFGDKEGWEEVYDQKGKLVSKEYYRDDYVY